MMNLSTDIKSLSERLLRLMVRNPDEVEVEITDYNSAIEITMHVDSVDTSKVIGSGGRNFKAIRAIIDAAAILRGKHAYVRPIKDRGERVESYDPFVARSDWPKQHVSDALLDTVHALVKFPEEAVVTIEDSGEKTCIEVYISSGESHETVTLVNDQVRTIFNAICRRQGRIAVIDVK